MRRGHHLQYAGGSFLLAAQPVNLSRHAEVAFGQAVNLVSPQRDGSLAPLARHALTSAQRIPRAAFRSPAHWRLAVRLAIPGRPTDAP